MMLVNTKWFFLLPALLSIGCMEEVWYKGCYEELFVNGIVNGTSIGPADERYQVVLGDGFSVTNCCHACYIRNFNYSAVQKGGHCHCHDNIEGFRPLQQQKLCVNRASLDRSALPLWIGQLDEVWSLYKSGGPYIINTTISIDSKWIVRGIPVVVEVTVYLASFRNISKGQETSLNPLNVQMSWTSENVSMETLIEAEGATVFGRIQHTFTEEGDHTFNVAVSNILSRWEDSITVYVIQAGPQDLQLAAIVDPSSKPSCVPSEYGDVQGKVVVFLNVPFQLEASVAVGTNLTFIFTVEGWESPFVQSPGQHMCLGDQCLAVVQDLVMESFGTYQVMVQVVNQYGSQQKSLTLIVIKDVLADPHFFLAAESQSVVIPRHQVKFIVTMEIRSRIGGKLSVDFSDGDIHTAELQDTNSTSLSLNCDQGEMFVSASYGQGCTLQIEFQHAFMSEGTYRPNVLIYNDKVNLTRDMDGYLTVIKRLQGAKLQSSRFVMLNTSAHFLLHLTSVSEVNVTYSWQIMYMNKTVLENFTSLVPQMSYMFMEEGEYDIVSYASNPISQTKALFNTYVQEPLSGLHVACSQNVFIKVEEDLHCWATVNEGSEPKFIWRLQNGQVLAHYTSKNGTSVVNHTFTDPGVYNMSVMAYNEVHQIIQHAPKLIHVQEPVLCVSLERFDGPVLYLGNMTHFLTTVVRDTDTHLDFEFNGGGRQRLEYDQRKYGDHMQFLTEYMFVDHGLHDVTVYAYNNVSEVFHTTKILVQIPVASIDVKVIGQATVNRPTVLLVQATNGQSLNEDLKYSWMFDQSAVQHTAARVVMHTFKSPGIHHVRAEASNFFLDSSEKTVVVYVQEDVSWYIDHVTAVPVNSSVSFSIQGNSAGWRNVVVDFGDGFTENIQGNRWSHSYSVPGIYLTTVSMQRDENVIKQPFDFDTGVRESLVLVQEKITGLKLIGSQIVKIENCYGKFRSHMWEAEMDTGTDVMYNWYMQGVRSSNSTTFNKFFDSFEDPGLYELTVEAYNYVSHAKVSIPIRFLHPVVMVTVRSRPIPLGELSIVNITVTGGRDVAMQVDFGDGTAIEVFTANTTFDIVWLSGKNNLPVYVVMVTHRYVAMETYKIKVSISNLVSSLEAFGSVLVGEPITGVKLYTDSPRIIDISEAVTVMATVDTGDDLEFQWSFSDIYSPSVISNGNTSTAHHFFNMAGEYSVSVAVSNYLYRSPVVQTLNFTFLPMDEVGELFISVDGEKYGAALDGMAPNLSTDNITFTARCDLGSNITFHFDFGDGVIKSVPGISRLYPAPYFEGKVNHRFTKEGAYNISVRASNALSSMTRFLDNIFYVQTAPQDLKLNTDDYNDVYYTKLGDVTIFRANISGGSEVKYDWKLGDQSDEINNAGSVVKHTYQLPGIYNVTVIARNKAANVSKKVQVFVEHEIQGVTLNISSTLATTSQELEFHARTFPHSNMGHFYEWNFGTQTKPSQSKLPFQKYQYRTVGNYTVTVSANNKVSNATSEPVTLHIQSEVQNLKIIHEGNHLVNQKVEFSVYFFNGNELTFVWDFGDGCKETTLKKRISHTYHRIDEYVVTLKAYNLISSQTVTSSIFILDSNCQPPYFVVHGNRNERVTKIRKSKEFYIEAELKSISCDITNATEYEWIFYNSTDYMPVALEGVPEDVFHSRILFIPPRVLSYGSYDLEVVVRAKGTIVYAKQTVHLVVEQSPLKAHIKGGLSREVRRDDIITLDGSDSRDPDSDSRTNLRYNWTCVANIVKPCFQGSFTDHVITDGAVMSFPGSWLNTEETDFIMKLTVSADGHPPQSTTQVLFVINQTVLELSVYCQQCKQELTNSNQPLTLQVVCMNCDKVVDEDDEVEYLWQVDTLQHDLAHISPARAHDNGKCVVSGNSTYKYLQKMKSDHDRKQLNMSREKTSLHSGRIIVNREQRKNTATLRSIATGTTVAPHQHILPIDIVEQPSTGRQPRGKRGTVDKDGRSTRSHRKRNMDIMKSIPYLRSIATGTTVAPQQHMLPIDIVEQPSTDIRENTDVDSRQDNKLQDLSSDMREGYPGESGSSASRPYVGMKIVEEKAGSRQVVGTSVDSAAGSGSGDTVMVEEPQTPGTNHIMYKKRIQFLLLKEDTRTGLNKSTLIIKPGILPQGLTYIISVKAKNKGGTLKGEAMISFSVNESPSLGDCSVKPDVGTEMETEFKIYCYEWEDEHLPLRYEVSYNLEQRDTRYLIYRGLQSSVKFKLPAGEPHNDYKVYVYVAILDALWGRTPVCYIPIEVRPKSAIPQHTSKEQLIYNEIKNSNGSVSVAIERGDSQKAKVLVRYLASQLNHLPRVVSNHNRQLREDSRGSLLDTIKNLPIRDELEILQTLQALVAVTEVKSELNIAALREAYLQIFSTILSAAGHLYKLSLTPSQDLLTLTMQASSNVISAVVEPHSEIIRQHLEKDTWLFKDIFKTCTDTLHGLIKNELACRTVGEQPIRRQTDFVSTFAARYHIKDTPTFGIDQSVFSLPSDMMTVLELANRNVSTADKFLPNQDCFQVHMTKFKKNPFLFIDKRDTSIDSEVGSLDIYNCEGQLVDVQSLHDNNMVSMEIPRKPQSNEGVTLHTLDKDSMNLHQFNISRKNLNKSLHIVVDLTPVSRGRLFPLTFLIRFNNHPHPEHHILRKEFDMRINTLKLFLPAGHFNVSGTYYLGIVDARYNAGRPRPGEITQRNYTIKMWWTKCLFWNRTLEEWSDNGCHTTDQSTYYITHCRCNHLTAFGSQFELIPNDLSFKPVDDFFALHENPVTVSLIGTILCIYAIVMVFCRKADLHDVKKGGITYLQDNTITDQQNYEVTIETGFRKGAGTTAKISIILHGEEGMSETRELISEDHRPLFERNSRDKFILSLPDSIGKIWKVQVWHNNFGTSPSWYLSRVIVRDLNNGNVYYFLTEKWLAVEEEDGKVEREFMALEGNLDVTKVFWAKGTQYMADYHIWTSLFTRPSYSQFTRTQRLTCCLTSIMMYMSLNAVWYHYTPNEYRGEFGLLDVSWRNVTVGAICCAVVIPVNLFIAFLFRRSKLQSSDVDMQLQAEVEKENKDYPSGKPDESSPDEEDDNQVQPVMTYSILDQSILNWPSIQDWAQKQWVKRQQSVMSIEDTTSAKTMVTTTNPPTSLTPTQILHKRVIGSETDQASSGFEDSNSTDPRPQMTISSQASSVKYKAPSVSSTVSQKSSAALSMKRKHHFFLPFWGQYVAWTLCALITVGCSVVTIFYGFRFGKTKSILWLQSLYFSFMVCMFIAHPVMILLAVVYTAVKYRHDPSILDHHEDGYHGDLAKIEIMRRKKEKAKETPTEQEEIERGVAARQRSRYLRFARPPQEKQLIEARKKIMKEKKALALVSNSAGFGLMFFLLCVMAYGKDNCSSSFYMNSAVKTSLMSSGDFKFEEISRPHEWYQWSQTSMLDVLYSNETYHHGNPNVIKNFALHGSSLVIGEVQIRQLKVREESCDIGQRLPHMPTFCHHDYGIRNRLTDTLWEVNQTWRAESRYFRLFGRHGTYDNSGYVVKLDKNRTHSLAQLRSLESRDWIDERTRAVIVSVTLFNAPTNLFSSVALLLELPPTGGVSVDCKVTSSYIYKYMTSLDNFILACELAFIILTLYKLKIELCSVIKLKQKYFLNAWNIIEFILSVMSLGFIVCYIYRFVLVSEAVDSMRSTYFEQFVDISFLALWDEILRAEVGLILFLVFVKSLRLLRYNKLLALFGNVYRRAHRELIIFSSLFIGLLMAFSSLGHALFGSVCYSFRDLWSGLFTMTALLTGSYKLSDADMTIFYFTRMFAFFFCVFVNGILLCYVVAFLSYHFRVYKRKQGDILAMSGHDALHFYWEKFLLWTGIKYEPPVHEPDNVLPPEFTMAEIEYQVDELFFRINALSGSHSLPEKPTGYLTDSDGTYGGGDDGISSGGSEVHQADDERLDQRVQQIEDYLCSQELYLAHILNNEQDSISKQKEKQLKSHLELEIFRQLQNQRHEDQSGQAEDIHGLDSKGEFHTGDKAAWTVESPADDPYGCSLNTADVESSPSDTISSSNPESPNETQKTTHTKKSPEKLSRMSACKLSDLSDKSGSLSSDSEKGLSTRGKQGDIKTFKKPEPPPKPTFINPGLRDVSTTEPSKSGLLGSPALRQLRSSLSTIERLSFKGENSGSSFTTESSSGSEQDAIHGMQRPIGKRNLRKTKSRGKGKGLVNLNDSLLDEFDAEGQPDFDLDEDLGLVGTEDAEVIPEKETDSSIDVTSKTFKVPTECNLHTDQVNTDSLPQSDRGHFLSDDTKPYLNSEVCQLTNQEAACKLESTNHLEDCKSDCQESVAKQQDSKDNDKNEEPRFPSVKEAIKAFENN